MTLTPTDLALSALAAMTALLVLAALRWRVDRRPAAQAISLTALCAACAWGLAAFAIASGRPDGLWAALALSVAGDALARARAGKDAPHD